MTTDDILQKVSQYRLDRGIKTGAYQAGGTFMRPEVVLNTVGLAKGMRVADLGCGAGFFTIPAANLVEDAGKVYAVDIQRTALSEIESKARMAGLQNIERMWADLEHPRTVKIKKDFIDLVILKSVLFQVQEEVPALKVAARIVKPETGQVLVIDWKKQDTPFGPGINDRVTEDEVQRWAEEAGLKFRGLVATDQYHFGMLFTK